MRLAVLSLLCLLTACFTEPSADRVWRCSVDQPLCPEGQTCVNDWCVKDGTATPDLAMPDLAMSSDMLPKAPCTDGFPIGTKGAWACRGKFSPTATKAAGLCQNGFKLCTDGFLISDAECSSSSVKGFFFADLPAQGVNTSVAKCVDSIPGVGAGSMWYGCGAVIGSSFATGRTQFPCKILALATYCDNQTLICNMAVLGLDAQRGENAANGVLCCP